MSSFDHTMVKMEIFEDVKKKKELWKPPKPPLLRLVCGFKATDASIGLMAARMPHGKLFTLRCVKYTNPARVKICTSNLDTHKLHFYNSKMMSPVSSFHCHLVDKKSCEYV